MPRKRGKGSKKGRKPHKGLYHPPELVIGGADPDSIWNHMTRFLQWMAEHQYSPHTIEGRARTIRLFAAWAAERGLMRPQEVTKPILERWQRHLFLYRKVDGEPLAVRTQLAHTHPLKAFFRWLARENHILYNPASELELPRIGRRLPRNVMTMAEAEKVLAVPRLHLPMGVRDRAMLETFYSTGVRRAELASLNLYDIDRERGVLMVREGKGRKDRVIPIGARALAWIDKYLADVRPDLACGADDGTLFLSAYGQALGV
jgi:integrase/recombinase XerD